MLRTEGELTALRADCVAEYGEEPTNGFTCDSCGYRFQCPSVFDWYNTYGDCLEEK